MQSLVPPPKPKGGSGHSASTRLTLHPAPVPGLHPEGGIWRCQGSAQFTPDLQRVKIFIYIDAASHPSNVETLECEARGLWLCPGGSS